MSLIDGLILVVLALALVRGYAVGGLRQLTSIVGMVLAFVCAIQFMRPFGGYMVDAWSVSPTFSELIAFTAIFLIVYIGVAFLVRMAEHIIKALRLGVLDNVLGSVLSAGKVLLVLSGIFLLLAHAGWPDRETKENSAFYEPVRDALPVAWDHTAAYIGDTDDLYEFFPGAVDDETAGADDDAWHFSPTKAPGPDDTPNLFGDDPADFETGPRGW